MRKTVPRSKIIYIVGCEEFEVWPKHCVNGHNCIQCYFMGKTKCAPRFWAHGEAKPSEMPLQESKTSKAPVELRALVLSLDKYLPSAEGTLYEFLAAQPVEPLNDGGFTEEMTERVNARASQLCGSPEPYRTIDEPCPRCGYQYSLACGAKNGKQRYCCPRCGKSWQPSPRGIPRGLKELVQKLRREGLAVEDIQRQVEKIYYYRKLHRATIERWTKGEKKTCKRCGYQYSLYSGTDKAKLRYHCPRCGKCWVPCPQELPAAMKELVRRLRHEGLSNRAIQEEVGKIYYRKINRNTISKWTKEEKKRLQAEDGSLPHQPGEVPTHNQKFHPGDHQASTGLTIPG